MTRSPSTFIVIAVMLTLDAIAQTSSLPSLQQIQQMPVEDRRAFYRNLKAGNANDLLVPLTQGLTDGDAIVRRNATGKAAFLIARLNQFAASGKPASLEPSNLQNLTEALTKSLSDSDREVRGFTVSALAYSGAPSPKTESMLLGRLPHEDEELRGEIIRTLAAAGYDSPNVNNALIAALADTSPKLRERAAAAIAVAKPPGALPKLAALLNDQGMVRDSVVQAIAAYGVEARPYISALQKLLTEPVGAPAPERVRAAIDAIEKLTPLPPPEPRVKAVNLAAGNQTAAPSGVAATVTPHPAPTTRVPSATPAASPQSVMPIAQTPTATVEHRVPIWPWVVGILALIVIVAVVLKRRA